MPFRRVRRVEHQSAPLLYGVRLCFTVFAMVSRCFLGETSSDIERSLFRDVYNSYKEYSHIASLSDCPKSRSRDLENATHAWADKLPLRRGCAFGGFRKERSFGVSRVVGTAQSHFSNPLLLWRLGIFGDPRCLVDSCPHLRTLSSRQAKNWHVR